MERHLHIICIVGRHYFFNQTTEESAWSIRQSLIEGYPTSDDRGCLPLLKKGSKVEPLPRPLKSESLTLPPNGVAAVAAKAKASSAPLLICDAANVEAEEPPLEDCTNVNIESLVVVKGLGRGGFADVVEVKDTATGERFAMKTIAKKRILDRKARARLALEVHAMSQTDPSPFVQRCHAAFESPTNIFFVVDLCSGGDLYFHLASQRSEENEWKIPEKEGRILLAELALAVEHVHGQGYIHKDIKIENVMLDHRGHVKLVDFGLADKLVAEEAPLDRTGSLTSMAPELLRDRTGGRHTDWWAYGILAYELLTGHSPWSCLDNNRVIQKEIQRLEINFPLHLSHEARLFLGGLLERNVKTRLGTKSDREVRGAKFFENIDWEATALLESFPAFVPSSLSVEDSVSRRVLSSYTSRPEELEAEDFAWFIGFDRVTKHPRYQAD